MYKLPKLEYSYNALEPHIDKKTMMVHHKKHHQGYVNKLNIEMKQKKHIPIQELQKKIPATNHYLRNNGGGHYNHTFFWKCMTDKKSKKNIDNYPELKNAIEKRYNSIEGFYKAFQAFAVTVFGSGWCWLVMQDDKLKIVTTKNQDNPLMKKIKDIDHGIPLLGLDVWEHAYYLKYQNKRGSYINAFFNVINWEFVNQEFMQACK